MKKKLLTALFAVLMVMVFTMPMFAADVTATTSSVSARRGEEVTFEVTLSKAVTVKAISVSVELDSSVLQVLEGKWTNPGALNTFDMNTLMGANAGTAPMEFGGTIFTLKCKVLDAAAFGDSEIKITVTTQNDTPVEVESVAGKVTVICDHSFTKTEPSEASLKSPATCKAKAVYYKTCATCGANGTETYEAGEFAAHEFTKTEPSAASLVSGATCTAKAVYYKTCVGCGANGTETYESGEMLPHDYTAKVVDASTLVSAADCDNAAVYYYSCSVCSAVGTDTFTDGEELGHTGGEATCQAKAVCTRCNEEYGATTPHDYSAKVENTDTFVSDATCTSPALYHYTCVDCGLEGTETYGVGEKLPHTFTKKRVEDTYLKLPATCTTVAVYYYSCETCAQKGNETFEEGTASGHSYSTKYSSDATNHWFACSGCGDQKDVEAHLPGAAPTATTPQVCTVCSYIIKPALGHVTHEYSTVYENDATGHWKKCTGCNNTSGYAVHVYSNDCDTSCNTCDYTRVTTHDFDTDWVSNGTQHWHVCSDCGEKTAVASHTAGAAATCTADQVCTVCNAVLASKTGHTASDWIVDREATEYITGKQHKECTVCGEVLETETLPVVVPEDSDVAGDTDGETEDDPTVDPDESTEADEDKVPGDNKGDGEDDGCDTMIGASAVVLALALAAPAVIVLKKKENE